MFGPFLAVGLVELVAELKLMPNVEVVTYLHQSWPSLVEDLNRQPKGTHTLVVGYSLGANSTMFVANKVDHINSIIALQPSMLSWNPELTGKVGKIVEIYNPNPEMTLGGMGSKKLVGENIEYIANTDTHLGTQFNSEFRNLVKSEIARLSAGDGMAAAQTDPIFAGEAVNPDSSHQNRPNRRSMQAAASASSTTTRPRTGPIAHRAERAGCSREET